MATIASPPYRHGRPSRPRTSSSCSWWEDRKVQVVDVKFCDLPGTWQHFSIPAGALDEGVFHDGLGFDGSSIRGTRDGPPAARAPAGAAAAGP